MEAFRNADRRVGGGFVYGAVVRYLETEIAPRLVSGSDDVFDAVTAVTEMVGWMAHDAGHDDLALQHFDRAAQFASMAGDIELKAHVQASLGHLAMQQGRPRDAMSRAKVGLALLRQRHQSTAVAARLHAVHARALAALRRRADCGRALMRAELALDGESAESCSPWVSPFDHASLAADASEAMETLGSFSEARQHAELILRVRDAGHVRSRTFGQLRLARVLVELRELDHACVIAMDALSASTGVSSGRVAQLLRSLHESLEPHTSAVGVCDVVVALAAATVGRPDPVRLITFAQKGE